MTDIIHTEIRPNYFGVPRKEIAPLLPERMDRVLEIGCGSGATLQWLRERRRILFAAGIEISSEAARMAGSVFDRVVTGNAEAVEIPGGNFDIVIALDVLEHLVDPWAMVDRLRNALRPGGVLIASIPNIAHYSKVFRLAFFGEWTYEDEGLLDRTHLRFFTKKTAIDLLTRSGLVLEKIENVRVWPRQLPMGCLKLLLPGRLVDYQFLIRVRKVQ